MQRMVIALKITARVMYLKGAWQLNNRLLSCKTRPWKETLNVMPVDAFTRRMKIPTDRQYPGNRCCRTSECQLGRSCCNCLCICYWLARSNRHGTQHSPESDINGKRSWPWTALGAGQEPHSVDIACSPSRAAVEQFSFGEPVRHIPVDTQSHAEQKRRLLNRHTSFNTTHGTIRRHAGNLLDHRSKTRDFVLKKQQDRPSKRDYS